MTTHDDSSRHPRRRPPNQPTQQSPLVFYSHHTPDGRLYEIVDDEGQPIAAVTIDSLVETWENRRTEGDLEG